MTKTLKVLTVKSLHLDGLATSLFRQLSQNLKNKALRRKLSESERLLRRASFCLNFYFVDESLTPGGGEYLIAK